jgi:hypothetical protein
MVGLPQQIHESGLSGYDNIADVSLMRQSQSMNGNKLIALSWWTFAYVIVAGALFAFSASGDCLQGADGAACRHQSSAFTQWLLIGEVLIYGLLTWAIFRRR